MAWCPTQNGGPAGNHEPAENGGPTQNGSPAETISDVMRYTHLKCGDGGIPEPREIGRSPSIGPGGEGPMGWGEWPRAWGIPGNGGPFTPAIHIVMSTGSKQI